MGARDRDLIQSDSKGKQAVDFGQAFPQHKRRLRPVCMHHMSPCTVDV